MPAAAFTGLFPAQQRQQPVALTVMQHPPVRLVQSVLDLPTLEPGTQFVAHFARDGGDQDVLVALQVGGYLVRVFLAAYSAVPRRWLC